MRLNPDFIVHSVDGNTLLVPTASAEFHGLIRGNKSVGVILGCLEKGATEEEIVNTMLERFDANRCVIENDVKDVIFKLREVGAIID